MVRKSPEAFRTISEVADILDVPAHVLRFWESRFTQIKPTKRGGGRRYYRPHDIDLLRGLRDLLHGEGMTIKAVQALLREHGAKHVATLGHVDLAVAAPDAVVLPPDAARAPAPQPRPTSAAPPPQPPRQPALRIAVPEAAENPAEAQYDLFAHADRREKRPFPPDPAIAARREELRSIIAAMQKLRSRMAAA